MDPIELRRQLGADLKRQYDQSLHDEQRERDRLVDAIRECLRELDRFVGREGPLRLSTDASRPPSRARLDRLSEVLFFVDEAVGRARRKL